MYFPLILEIEKVLSGHERIFEVRSRLDWSKCSLKLNYHHRNAVGSSLTHSPSNNGTSPLALSPSSESPLKSPTTNSPLANSPTTSPGSSVSSPDRSPRKSHRTISSPPSYTRENVEKGGILRRQSTHANVPRNTDAVKESRRDSLRLPFQFIFGSSKSDSKKHAALSDIFVNPPNAYFSSPPSSSLTSSSSISSDSTSSYSPSSSTTDIASKMEGDKTSAFNEYHRNFSSVIESMSPPPSHQESPMPVRKRSMSDADQHAHIAEQVTRGHHDFHRSDSRLVTHHFESMPL